MNGQWGTTKRNFSNEHMALVDGWLKCSCGCRVIYGLKTKKIKATGETKTYHYYHCTNGKRAHMKLDNIKGEKIWEQFGSVIEKINISEEFAKDISEEGLTVQFALKKPFAVLLEPKMSEKSEKQDWCPPSDNKRTYPALPLSAFSKV